MREIDVTIADPLQYARALVLGASGAGKTHFAASAPAPLFISDTAEGGFATIKTMDPRFWWDPEVPPKVWAVEDAFGDIPPMLARLEAMKASGNFPFRTIVVDPISIYADRVIAEMQVRASQDSKKALDGRQMYGDLLIHLRVLMLRLHALPCHVLWLCHVKEGNLALAGQTAEKLPAHMDYKWLCTRTQDLSGDKFQLHTQPFGAFNILGGRWTVANSKGQRFGLPSPMIPSFKAIAQINGWGEPVSKFMPGVEEGTRYTWPPED